MADEAPMALDVPIDETVVEDPVRVAGPSAGKAQTLLAEFAARREAALGKADTLGRFEPAMSAGKTAAPSILADSRTEAAPKIAATATQNLSRTKESSLGSKPAVKRPAPKARGSRSALMGFVLTILLLIALAAAAAFSSFISSAWNVDSATTAVASVQPSVADEVAADLPDDDVMAPRVACCGAWFRFDMKFESYENCSSHSGRSRSSIR
jgi:Na+-transporting methylmalonyl-CoA/oxaloacetate decarboxylase gamma subunit